MADRRSWSPPCILPLGRCCARTAFWNGSPSIGTARSGPRTLRDSCRVSEQAGDSCRTGVTTRGAGRGNSRLASGGRAGAAASRVRRVPVLPGHQRAPRARAARGEGPNSAVRDGLFTPAVGHSQRSRDSTPVSALHGERSGRHTPRRHDDDAFLHSVPARLGRATGRCCSRDADGSPHAGAIRVGRTPPPRSFATTHLHILLNRRVRARRSPHVRRGVFRVRRMRSDVGPSATSTDRPSRLARVAVISGSCPTIP